MWYETIGPMSKNRAIAKWHTIRIPKYRGAVRVANQTANAVSPRLNTTNASLKTLNERKAIIKQPTVTANMSVLSRKRKSKSGPLSMFCMLLGNVILPLLVGNLNREEAFTSQYSGRSGWVAALISQGCLGLVSKPVFDVAEFAKIQRIAIPSEFLRIQLRF